MKAEEVKIPISAGFTITTTKLQVNFENETRFFSLHTDESQYQTARILQLQRSQAMGVNTTVESEKEFAENVIDLINDHKYRKFLGKNSRKFAEEQFSWESITKKLNECYLQLIKNNLD